MNTQAQVSYDTEGYLINPEQWDNSVALTLATDEDIELNTAYWLVLHFMHDYWTNIRWHRTYAMW